MSPAEVSQGEAHTDHHAARPRDARWLARRVRLGARIVWHAIWHLINDGGMTYAGHIAFMTLFSLFPFLIFLTTLAAEIGQTEAAQEFVTLVLSLLPSEVSAAIEPAIV